MTQTDLDWLQMKRAEAWKAEQRFGEITRTWDLAMFLKIIDAQQGLIRRLKTQAEAK